MNNDQHIWHKWADSLHRWGIIDLTIVFLDAIGPLHLLGAQFVYFGQPLLESFFPRTDFNALAGMLEDSNQTDEFVRFLRQADQVEAHS